MGTPSGCPRKGWLKDGQSPKGLVEGGARNLGVGPRRKGGGERGLQKARGFQKAPRRRFTAILKGRSSFRAIPWEPVRANLAFQRTPPRGQACIRSLTDPSEEKMTHMGAHGPTRAVASRRAFGNPRKGWLKDGQSPKGLVEGGARILGGSRAEGGRGGR